MSDREHSVETIRRSSQVIGRLEKLMVANRGVSFLIHIYTNSTVLIQYVLYPIRK